MHIKFRIFVFISLLAGSLNTQADDYQVTVAEPFLEIHTGPGRGYPIFHITESGQTVLIKSRRTDWFKVSTNDRQPKSGWVHLRQIEKTLNQHGRQVTFSDANLLDVSDSNFEWSIEGGSFGGVNTIGTAVRYRMTPHLSTEIKFSQILGDFSDSEMVVLSLQHSPFPEKRLSPYFQLGTGLLRTQSFATIVQPNDDSNQTINVGTGIKFYLARHFITHVDYRYHTVLTSRDNNEEIHEWNLGFRVFF